MAPTDSRLRPDQRLMEDGRWQEANQVKQQLEEKQRIVRRQRENNAEAAASSGQYLASVREIMNLGNINENSLVFA